MKMINDKLRYMFWCGILIAIGVYLLGNFEREKNNRMAALFDGQCNYDGYYPHDIEIVFSRIPMRVVALRPEIADTIIALGAGQSVIAAYIAPERSADMVYFQENLPNAKLFVKNPTKEEIILLNPDFIIGWHGSFSDKSLGNVRYWNSRGVPTYIEENSGAMPNPYPPFNMSSDIPPFSIKNEIQFIKNMGKIFDKEEMAAQEIKKYRMH